MVLYYEVAVVDNWFLCSFSQTTGIQLTGLHNFQKRWLFKYRMSEAITDEQRQKIKNLRAVGNEYKKISKLLSLLKDTVKSSANGENLSV